MPIGRIATTASILALLLAAAVPVDAAPSLQTGVHSNYNLSASISFFQTCVPSTSTSFVCPLMAVCNPIVETCGMTTDITGTIGWTVTDLTATSASLNVTRDLTISSSDSTRPVIQSSGSVNESIDLATRFVSLFPTIMPEMDQILQMAQASATTSMTGVNLPDSMTTLDNMISPPAFYTMWWVNGPLKLNQTVPVLVLPTNVTRSSTIDLGGSIGSRDAWTLDFNFSRPLIVPDPSTSLGLVPGESMEVGFVFNYDKTSDMLLSANAEVHFGFQNEIALPPTPCDPSISTVCPATNRATMILGNFGVNIEASLKLSNTTVDLSHRMKVIPPENNDGSQSSGGSNNGNGSGTNNGSGSNDGTIGAGSRSNGNGASGSSGQPSSNSKRPGYGGQASNWPTWIYALLGILAAMIIGSALWVSRRHSRKLRTDSTS